jgi:hypothetical protein
MEDDISIVVFANAKDFFLAKICIASIRYFYPNIEIFLVKDQLNGRFNSSSLESRYNVKELKLSNKYFGWGAAKLQFLIDIEDDRKFLILDSDIIFVGNVLSKFEKINYDYIVSCETYELTDVVKSVFVDPEKAIEYFPSYSFPGFFFNTGQVLVNPSKIRKEDFLGIFDPKKYPYYQDYDTFSYVDQSILNALLPALKNQNRISLYGIEFMKASGEFFRENVNNSVNILDKNLDFLIHWAGDVRDRDLRKMNGYELLNFFQENFEAGLTSIQKIRHRCQNLINATGFLRLIKLKKNRIFIEISQRWR